MVRAHITALHADTQQAPWATVDVNWFYINENELTQIPGTHKGRASSRKTPTQNKACLNDNARCQKVRNSWKGMERRGGSGGGLVRQFAEAASIVFSLKQLTITYPV